MPRHRVKTTNTVEKMPHNRVKTTNRGTTSESTMQKAFFGRETPNFVRKLSERNNPGIKFEDSDNMLMDKVDIDSINYLISEEQKKAITEGPENIDLIPRLKTEERFTPSFLFSDRDNDSRFAPETLNLIRKLSERNNPKIKFENSDKLSERNNPGIKFEDSDNMLMDKVDIDSINYLISEEQKKAITEGPENIDLIPRLKTEERFTPSFLFSDRDNDSRFAPETLNLIRKLSERNNPKIKFENSDKLSERNNPGIKFENSDNMLMDKVDIELINYLICEEQKKAITEGPENIDLIPRLKTEERFTPSFLFSDRDNDSLFAPETLNLIRKLSERNNPKIKFENSDKLSEQNNPGIKFENSDNMLMDKVDIESINYLISEEQKKAITEGPENIDLIPRLKTEESFTPSFLFSDRDNDSLFAPETLNLIRKLSERNNPGTQKQE